MKIITKYIVSDLVAAYLARLIIAFLMSYLADTALVDVDSACWILDVTIIEILGEQALHILLSPEAGLGDALVIPLDYFPFLQRELAQPEPACGWVPEGNGITSTVYWPELGQRCSVNRLHGMHFEYQMATMYALA